MKVAIIGAGLGGLAASCMLAYRGHDVRIIEKNSSPGGKINEVSAKGFRFDTGPSLLTMPFILQRMFEFCGENFEDYLKFRPVDPICRYFYPNGIQFDCYHDSGLNIAQIQEFAPDDIQAYKDFQSYSKELYERTKDTFLFNPLYGLSDLKSLNFADLFRIDALKTVAERVDMVFESDELRKFFKRFTTYNGSSPFQAPATLNVIPHVELALGGFYIEGGMYSLIKALIKLSEKFGVKTEYDTEVKRICTAKGKVSGIVDTNGNRREADIVISNADAAETYLQFLNNSNVPALKKKKLSRLEPSCSGFVLLLGLEKKYNDLKHHNIFFPEDYKREFDQIFNQKVMPDDPTIYVADTSHTNPSDAPEGGSNLFVLVNAPYLNNQYSWDDEQKKYRKHLLNLLHKKGLTDIEKHTVFSESITPKDFYQRYRSYKGSIYGTSSNSRLSAFWRPRNKSRSIKGLYLVGGSTHPGGGIPLVVLSAFHAVELIKRFEN